MPVNVLEQHTPGFLSRRAVNTQKNALSRVLASRAAELEFVVETRKRVGQLIRFEDVSEWIKDESSKDPKGAVRGHRAGKYICWFSKGGQFPEIVPAPPNSVLENIRQSAVRLSELFPWSEPKATVFLLSGEVPSVPAVSIKISGKTLFPASARILMDVEIWQKPSDIGNFFRWIQRKLLLDRKRQRGLTPKHLALAVFASENKHNKTYRELKVIWNRKHPGWGYFKSDEHFAKDCKRAQDKLLMVGERIGTGLQLITEEDCI